MSGIVALWADYNNALIRVPIRTKCITSFFCFLVSQILSQLLQKGRIASLEKIRDFAIWGFFLPVPAHHWQNFMAFQVPSSLFVKIPINHICWRMPILFVFGVYNKLMEGSSLSESWVHTVKTNPPLQVTMLKIWPLMNAINFTVVPLRLRVLFENVVLFFWALYLALKMKTEKKALGDVNAKPVLKA
eukprot:gnl/TRDRNA2_/TRDRNA2_34813_c0_seq1.p1 gnl/TRDRNA2_/TRDRNA2_34813_c0~~gnl/TRDRNA2_/TRDRNA2_34813_c0_seq1.p1  ORF type:complete len:188 (-),score=28.21 gnl/TRDRNA2_/TRDRNA2_34813_c0_seq1:67-630(-)